MTIIRSWRVDDFSRSQQKTSNIAFLTHGHRDHTQGLKEYVRKEKDAEIVCTEQTSKIIELLDDVPQDNCIIVRPGEDITFDGLRVSVVDANHCIGSVMFHFNFDNERIVATGDFRLNNEILKAVYSFSEPDLCYIDTTFDNRSFRFPTQASAITETVKIAIDIEKKGSELLLGSYLIGKERLFTTLSQALQKKVYLANPLQQKIYRSIGLDSFWTDKKEDSWISVVPMDALKDQKKLPRYGILSKANDFHKIIATGWACLKQSSPKVSYIPYSEHNDYFQLKKYRAALKAKREIELI